MPFSFSFLTSTFPAVPLTKRFTLAADGSIQKSSYPHSQRFRSETFEGNCLEDLYNGIVAYSKTGACLLKGTMHRVLDDESRADSTDPADTTQYGCFDLDGAPFPTAEAFMESIGFPDVSYIVQYSSSHGMPGSEGLSCHIFFLLSAPVAAPALKVWLLSLNLNNPALKAAIRLSRTGSAMHYPLDLTACQNDKLIYIATPVFGEGIKPPMAEKNRTKLIMKHVPHIAPPAVNDPEVLRKAQKDLHNKLRKDAGMSALRLSTRMVKDHEILSKPGEFVVTGMKVERGFRYFNFNGGDSWGYYQPENDIEFVSNFKGEPDYLLKEIAPDTYKQLRAEIFSLNATPFENGDLLLGFRDFATGTYYNGTYNEKTKDLKLSVARNETQLAHYYMSHGRSIGDYIPVWNMEFAPDNPVIVDEERHWINTYVPSMYQKNAVEPPSFELGDGWPTIYRVIKHCVGTNELVEHFLNWVAVILQLKIKPITAWVLHGTFGTGKGVTVNHILKPLFGSDYVVCRLQRDLESDFSGWLEKALIAFIDEIDVDSLENKGMVDNKLKSIIVEPTVSIRRMRTDSYEVKSFVGFIMSANKNQPVSIPYNDRRYNVSVYQTEPIVLSRDEIFKTIPAELQAFANYMMHREADVERSSKPLHTAEREAMMELSTTSVDAVAGALLSGDLEALWEYMPDETLMKQMDANIEASMYASLMKRFHKELTEKSESKITRDELNIIFEHCVGNTPPNAAKFSRYLSHHGIKTHRFRRGQELHYGIEVMWKASAEWMALANSTFETKLKAVK